MNGVAIEVAKHRIMTRNFKSYYFIYQLGCTGRCTQTAKPVRGAYTHSHGTYRNKCVRTIDVEQKRATYVAMGNN